MEILKEVEENKTLANYWISELRYISIPGIRNFINYKLGRLTELGAEIEVFVSSELEKIDSNSLSDKEYDKDSFEKGKGGVSSQISSLGVFRGCKED